MRIAQFFKAFFSEAVSGAGQRGSFVRNILHLSVGSVLAYVIGFLFTPIITRLFSPEVYGQFALFNSWIANLTFLATLCYSNALILPKNLSGFYALVRLCMVITIIVCITFFVIFSVFKEPLFKFFKMEGLDSFLYFLPVVLFLHVLFVCADNYSIWQKDFKGGSLSKLGSTVLAKASVTMYGSLVRANFNGFMLGEIVIRLVAIVLYLKRQTLTFFREAFLKLNLKELKLTAREFKEYPLYILPSSWLASFTTIFPILIMPVAYSVSDLGYFSLARAMLSLPSQMIGLSIGKVFFQKSGELLQTQDTVNFQRKFINVYYGTFFLALIPFGLVFSFGDILFGWYAGKDWTIAGVFAGHLALSAVFQFIWSVVSSIFKTVRQEKVQFWIDVIGSALVIVAILISIAMKLPVADVIFVLGATLAIRYLISVSSVFLLLKISMIRHLAFTVLLTGIVFLGFEMLRTFIF